MPDNEAEHRDLLWKKIRQMVCQDPGRKFTTHEIAAELGIEIASPAYRTILDAIANGEPPTEWIKRQIEIL